LRKISGAWDEKRRAQQFELFIHIVAEAKELNDVEALLEIVMTPSEKAAIAQRLLILRMIRDGAKYGDIELELRVSPSTITKAVDLYHKHGRHNHLFNLLLDRVHYQPKPEKITSDYSDPLKNSFNVGTKAFLREEAELKAKKQQNQ